MQAAFPAVFLRMAVPVTQPLYPPTDPHPLLGGCLARTVSLAYLRVRTPPAAST
ncbi:MAG TPA: hypothetical protein VKT82_10170 [Ktedonobacterales bacterium]|nr:hypothetical protein [Ktedonobacterales bacterium]